MVNKTWIGRARPRVEDTRLLTGTGRFAADVQPENCLHMAFLRSPFAAARIMEINTDGAAGADVVAVYTGDDTAGIASLPVTPIVEGIFVPPTPLLARGQVMAVGQPVAAVVARTLTAALDALENILVEYDDSAAPGDLFSDCPDNQAFVKSWQGGDTDAAFAEAETVVSVQIQHPRLSAMALESRAVVADGQGDDLTVWLSTQTPHRARTDVAGLLDLEPDKVRVIAVDVGGAFGAKASLHPEEVLVAMAAAGLQKPVKWQADRSEEFLAQCHGRGTGCDGQAAFAADGRLTGLKAEIRGLLGHWLPYSAAVPAWNAARILPGPYDVDDVSINMSARLSRTPAVNIYRGAGRPEAAMLMERLMDQGARTLGLDPVEIRRRNLLRADQLPSQRVTGARPDSGDYGAALEKLVEVSGYKDLRQQQTKRRDAGELFGIGLAFYIEPCGQGWESARVSINADGQVTAATGSSAQGQGRETAFQQIVADVLDVAPETVCVVHGDTALAPDGIGALASRSTAIGGSALLQAAQEVARHRHENPGQQDYQAEVIYEAEGEAWSYGACLATVDIDPETGVTTVKKIWWVDDCGTVINPTLVKGQIMGGIAQGLGEALMEKIVYDENGQLLSGSLMDYAVPHADDMPEIEVHQLQTPSPANLLGARGVGEAGTIGAPAAVMNAVLDALAPLGIDHVDMPATSAVVWQALQKAKTRDATGEGSES